MPIVNIVKAENWALLQETAHAALELLPLAVRRLMEG